MEADLERRVVERTRELTAANAALRRENDELRRTERAARELERESALIVNNLPNLVSLLSPSGVPEQINRQILDFTGKSEAELMGWSGSDLIHPEDRANALASFQLGIPAGEPFEIVYRMRRFDGAYRWFHARHKPLKHTDGRVSRWFVAVNDVDDRMRAEESLKISADNLKLIIDTIPTLVWSTHPNGTVEFLNQHYLDYVGLSAEQAQGWDWRAAVHPEDLSNLIATWVGIMASGKAGEAEARMQRFDGVYRWFLFRANPLRDEHGNLLKWYGTNVDIEDRKRAEAALSALHSEFAHLSRVSSFGVLTASVAHEISQPLSGILTNANACQRMLSAKPANVEGALATVQRTIRDGTRASEVIGRLRALFSKKTANNEEMDLNQAVAEVIPLASSDLLRNGVVLNMELSKGLPRLSADRVQLQQVILNLLLNASDAMSDVDDRKRQALVRTAPDGDGVRFSVQDVGVGFAVEDGERLFQAFYTTKTSGMGIGLCLSRSIVESHNGRLWGERNVGPGATFSFFIPVTG